MARRLGETRPSLRRIHDYVSTATRLFVCASACLTYLQRRIPTAAARRLTPSPHTCASSTSTRTAVSISSRHVHSSGECRLCSPVDRFGVGRPSSVSREPSVPPRMMPMLRLQPGPLHRLLGVTPSPAAPSPGRRPCCGTASSPPRRPAPSGTPPRSCRAIVAQQLGLLGELRRVEVAQQDAHASPRPRRPRSCTGAGTPRGRSVVSGRQRLPRQPVEEQPGQADGVDHPPLGDGRVDVDAA